MWTPLWILDSIIQPTWIDTCENQHGKSSSRFPTRRVQRGPRYPPHTQGAAWIQVSGPAPPTHPLDHPIRPQSMPPHPSQSKCWALPPLPRPSCNMPPTHPATCTSTCPRTQPPAQARARAPSHLHKHAPRDDAPFQYPILMLIRIHHGMIRRIGQVPHSCPLHSRLLPTARNLNRHHQHPQLHTCMAATAAAAAAATTTG